MAELLRFVVTILVYCLALPLAAVTGYCVFKLIRGTRWPTILGRYLAAALATVSGMSVFVMTFWALGQARAFSRRGTPPPRLGELLEVAGVLGLFYAAFFVLRYTRLGRRLNRPVRWRRGV